MRNSFTYRLVAMLIASFMMIASNTVFAQLMFEDVSDSAGGFAIGERWGASWGDFNGDLRPDVFVNNHNTTPAAMYLNNGDGTFSDVIYAFDRNRTLLDNPRQDAHGATFVDFDNDGDQDLLSSFSSGSARLFVNNNGVFTDQASNSDLQNDSSSRMPAWVDYNNDGFLDVFYITSNSIIANIHDPDGSGGFIGDFDVVSNSSLGISCGGNYGQLADVNNDGRLDLICGDEGAFPKRVYNTNSIPFGNITSVMPSIASVVDSVVADFDGNLQSDFFLVRGRLRPTEALKVDAKRIEAWLAGTSSNGKGFRFNSGNGEITLTFDANKANELASKIKIGSSGFSPSSIPFTLDPNNSSTHGISSSSSGTYYVGFNNSTGQWEVELRTSSSKRAYVQIETENNASDPVMYGLGAIDLPIANKLVMNNAGGFVEQAASRGITGQEHCVGAATADFDNDMDPDIYMICRTGISNIANIMYENQGDGTFVKVAGGAGAQGPIGAGLLNRLGTAESVITADYDLDGFIDLFVTNGLLMQPTREGGPDKLYRNLGNSNHWVQIDLEGNTSTTPFTGDNRDGIGAKVFVTAAGKTQVREQGHGYHRWSQDFKRLHFGLAGNTQFNVEVRWQNGFVDNFNNVSADQIYNIKQGNSSGNGSIVAKTAGAVNYPPVPAVGDECGEPSFNGNFDRAVFVWKDCSSNRWEVRTMAGGSPVNLVFKGNVTTDSGSFTNVVPLNLQGNDSFNSTSNLISFTFNNANAGQDAFRFNAPGGGTTQACLQFTELPQGVPVLLGADTVYLGSSADLGNFQVCSGPPPAGNECGEPSYDRGSESGLFIWKDCNITGSQSWHIRATGGGNSPALTYRGLLNADQNFTGVTPFSIEAGDTLDNSSNPMQISYIMKAGGAGQDGFDFTFSNSTDVCFDPSVMPAGAAVELGANRQVMSTAFDLGTLASCSPPSQPLECGQPSYSAGSEKALFIWKDCTGSGDWHMRATGGGDPDKQTYTGSITSSLGYTAVTPFSIEASDTLDNSSDPNVIDFSLGMRNSGQDGVDFDFSDASNTCFDASVLPSGVQVLLGDTKAVMSVPFDLATQGSCL